MRFKLHPANPRATLTQLKGAGKVSSATFINNPGCSQARRPGLTGSEYLLQRYALLTSVVRRRKKTLFKYRRRASKLRVKKIRQLVSLFKSKYNNTRREDSKLFRRGRRRMSKRRWSSLAATSNTSATRRYRRRRKYIKPFMKKRQFTYFSKYYRGRPSAVSRPTYTRARTLLEMSLASANVQVRHTNTASEPIVASK